MAWNGQNQNHNQNQNQMPPNPWDFFQGQGFGQGSGQGVDHMGPDFPQGFPFGPGGFGGPWGHRGGGWGGWGGPGGRGEWGRHWGRHGRRHRRGGEDGNEPPTDGEGENNNAEAEDTPMLSENEKGAVSGNEKDGSPATLRAEDGGEHPDPPESIPHHPGRHGHHHHHQRHFGPGGFHGRGRGRWGGMRGHHGHGPHHGPPGPTPPFPWSVLHGFAQHPVAHQIRDYIERANNGANANANRSGGDDEVESFSPPVDVFRTAGGWVLHVAVPGARKEDTGVHWDAGKGSLSVSGVVYRPGDEDFLAGLVSSERRVGLFMREVRLPPVGTPATAEGLSEKDEVDGEGITARMEDGVLVINVPVVEREWTEVRKVDIM